MAEDCDLDPTRGVVRYDIYMMMYSTVFILQLLLMFHTIYHECTKRNSRQFQLSATMRISYVVLQIIALMWISCNILLMLVDPNTQIISDSIFCGIIAHLIYYPLIIQLFSL